MKSSKLNVDVNVILNWILTLCLLFNKYGRNMLKKKRKY